MHPSQDELLPLDSRLSLKSDLIALDEAEAFWGERSGGKITARNWLRAMLAVSGSESASLRGLAFCLGLEGPSVSKQAVHERMGGSEALMGLALARSLAARAPAAALPRGAFRRILAQDSTAVALPDRLRGRFAYSFSGGAAMMRVQAVYDLLAGRFVSLDLRPHLETDQKASPGIAAELGPGDLLVRDLGYYSYEAFAAIAATGARFLSRLHGQSVVCGLDGRRLDLPGLLSLGRGLDMPVLLGGRRAPAVPQLRLVALPVPPEVAAERRRRLRRDSPKVSERLLRLQDWTIFLTNAPAEELAADAIADLYRQRWTIEILFKSWKSGLGIARVPARASCAMAVSLVMACLIRSTLAQALVAPAVESGSGRYASACKLATLAALLAGRVPETPEQAQALVENILRHSLMERRRKPNLKEALESVLA